LAAAAVIGLFGTIAVIAIGEHYPGPYYGRPYGHPYGAYRPY
jgi:hypothetical protein